jgi:hypothetical protein
VRRCTAYDGTREDVLFPHIKIQHRRVPVQRSRDPRLWAWPGTRETTGTIGLTSYGGVQDGLSARVACVRTRCGCIAQWYCGGGMPHRRCRRWKAGRCRGTERPQCHAWHSGVLALGYTRGRQLLRRLPRRRGAVQAEVSQQGRAQYADRLLGEDGRFYRRWNCARRLPHLAEPSVPLEWDVSDIPRSPRTNRTASIANLRGLV